jgi:hypothetical protein
LRAAIRQERREARCGTSGERLDEPGARRPKTRGKSGVPDLPGVDGEPGNIPVRWAGRFCANPVGNRLVRTASPAGAAFLDLVAKSLRQNASNKV